MNAIASRLPIRTKAGYGTAEMGMAAAEVMVQLYLLEFYTRAVGLRAELAGFALALAMLWDAFTDVTMGIISDHTRTKWGRRRPYLLAGAVVLSGAYILLFTPPDLDTQLGKFLFLFGAYIFVNTSYTLINVPHAALAAEMSFDRNERTEIFGWRMLFRNFGFVLGTLLPGYMLTYYEELRVREVMESARSVASGGVSIAIVATTLVTLWSVRRIDTQARMMQLPPGNHNALAHVRTYFREIQFVARSKVFAPLLLAFFFAQIGRTINASLALYYYKIHLRLSETQIVSQILLVFIVVLSLSIAIWVWISRKWGKKWPAFLGAMFLGVSTIVIYPLLPRGHVLPPILFSSVLGGFAVGSIVLFESLVADVVDYDELRTGDQREGLYFGAWTMVTKISRAIGLALTGILLNAIGFQETAVMQPAGTGWRIALLYGPVVGAFFIVAALVFLVMPLTDERHRRIQRLLLLKRARHSRVAA